MGNKYWKERLGATFQPYFAQTLGVRIGKPDLIAIFLWRMASLVRQGGSVGTLATQSITEGDSEAFVRAHVTPLGVQIVRATRSRAWPGSEAVLVALLWVVRGPWAGVRTIDGDEVGQIGSDLRSSRGSVEVHTLASAPFVFQGIDNSRGMALVVQATSEIARDPAHAPFVRPYVSGEDLSGPHPLDPPRVVVDLTRIESEDALGTLPPSLRDFVEEQVRPTRTRELLRSYRGLADRWWTFWNTREDGFARVRQRQQCVGAPAVAKHFFALRLPSAWAFTNKVFIFDLYREDVQVLLLSSIFKTWMDWRGGTLGEGQAIKVQQVVGTFPTPDRVVAVGLSAQWQSVLLEYTGDQECTVTEVLNRVHDPAVDDVGVSELRSLAVAIDHAVASCFEWQGLELGHGHHTTEHGVRFTIAPGAQERILDLLIEENHRRHDAEVKAGLVSADGKKKVRKKQTSSGASLF
jgi:hypothetical protein